MEKVLSKPPVNTASRLYFFPNNTPETFHTNNVYKGFHPESEEVADRLALFFLMVFPYEVRHGQELPKKGHRLLCAI